MLSIPLLSAVPRLLPLPEGTTSIGREAACSLCLPDPSVSRRHVEIVHHGGSVYVQDLDSRNGMHVNGVTRKMANLKPGDVLRVGVFEFRLAEGAVPPRPAAAGARMRAGPELDVTIPRQIQLPESRAERHWDTLYHVCFWLTEGFDEAALRERCLPLLHESFQGEFVQMYGVDRQLVATVPEATVVKGKEVKMHQRNVGNYNYLIGPVRLPGGDPHAACPFLLVARRTDWNDFDAQDRVLMQAVCQLWARTLTRVREIQSIRQENESLKKKAGAVGPVLLGRSVVMEQLRTRAARAARTSASILLEGETGSGKEVVGHFIHTSSPRAQGPFVKMNCAAIPEGLIESELFGHVKGAFTGSEVTAAEVQSVL